MNCTLKSSRPSLTDEWSWGCGGVELGREISLTLSRPTVQQTSGERTPPQLWLADDLENEVSTGPIAIDGAVLPNVKKIEPTTENKAYEPANAIKGMWISPRSVWLSCYRVQRLDKSSVDYISVSIQSVDGRFWAYTVGSAGIDDLMGEFMRNADGILPLPNSPVEAINKSTWWWDRVADFALSSPGWGWDKLHSAFSNELLPICAR